MIRQNPWTKGEIETAIDLAKKGMKAAEIAAQLKGRTRNAVIGLLHRRKIMMSVFQNKPYPTKLPPVKSEKPDRKVNVAKIKEVKKQEDKFHDLAEMVEKNVVYGKVSILDAHRSQCRWIEGVGRMVCGDPIVNNSSWCRVHYLRVFTPVSVAKAAALEARKRREIERWPERKRF